MTNPVRGLVGRDRPLVVNRILVSLSVIAMLASACGSEGSGSTPTSPAATEVASTESATVPDTEAPVVTEVPEERLMVEPIDCVVPADLAVDSAGVPYELSEPFCIGGWLLAYPACEFECESSFALEMVDGEWQSRGFVYNICYGGAVSSGLPEPIALYYVRSPCDFEGESEMFLIGDEPATGELSIGDFGPRVAALDLALSEAGFLVEEPNNQFEYETLKAVLDLQFQLGLDVDGLAGPMTLGSLGLS